MEQLGERPAWSMSGAEVLSTLDQLDAALARQETYRLQLIARMDVLGHAQEIGAHNTAQLLEFRYRLDRSRALRDVRLARLLSKYDAVSTALPDPHDDPTDGDVATEDESAEVVLRPAQAEAIVSALEQVPSTVPAEDLAVAERELVGLGRHLSPFELRRAGQRVRDVLDADGPEPEEHKAFARETLTMSTADRGVKFRGYLANENAELLRSLIHAGARPHKTADGEPDPRSREKRQADALTTTLTIAATALDAGAPTPRTPRPQSSTPSPSPDHSPPPPHTTDPTDPTDTGTTSPPPPRSPSQPPTTETASAAANSPVPSQPPPPPHTTSPTAEATTPSSPATRTTTGLTGLTATTGATGTTGGSGSMPGPNRASGESPATSTSPANGTSISSRSNGTASTGPTNGAGIAHGASREAPQGPGMRVAGRGGATGGVDRGTDGASDVPGFGAKANITVTIDLQDLKSAAADAIGDTVYGDGLSAAAIRRLACDAKIIPLVLGTNSEPLDVGRAERLVTRAMRRALNTRDKGCVVCGAPPIQCDAHHLTSWIDGGETKISNLVLLCRRHHIDLHAGDWTITITNGQVHVARPTWADPPRHNPTTLNTPNAPGSHATRNSSTSDRPPANTSPHHNHPDHGPAHAFADHSPTKRPTHAVAPTAAPHSRPPTPRAPANHPPSGQAPNNRTPAERPKDTRTRTARVTPKRMPMAQAAENRTPIEQTPGSGARDKHPADRRTQVEQATEDHARAGQPTGQRVAATQPSRQASPTHQPQADCESSNQGSSQDDPADHNPYDGLDEHEDHDHGSYDHGSTDSESHDRQPDDDRSAGHGLYDGSDHHEDHDHGSYDSGSTDSESDDRRLDRNQSAGDSPYDGPDHHEDHDHGSYDRGSADSEPDDRRLDDHWPADRGLDDGSDDQGDHDRAAYDRGATGCGADDRGPTGCGADDRGSVGRRSAARAAVASVVRRSGLGRELVRRVRAAGGSAGEPNASFREAAYQAIWGETTTPEADHLTAPAHISIIAPRPEHPPESDPDPSAKPAATRVPAGSDRSP
ncbi:DUF222 domain-containing protein [Kribbella sp. NPDC051586]|uniref:DUF222 domain-containing protein n=1 Tax=Kribbella sp. NPDC051586 TaxID=3364118 RepID=UPI00378B73CF